MSLDDLRLAEVLEVDKQFEQRPALPGVDLELLVIAVDRMGELCTTACVSSRLCAFM